MSESRPFTVLNPRQIKKDYPKTYKSIVEWLKKCSLEGNVLTEEMIEAFLYGNPRFLYDYFDDMKLCISIITDGTEWNATVADTQIVNFQKNRKDIEELAFNEAFKEQEAKL
jgi:hypothetical protein